MTARMTLAAPEVRAWTGLEFREVETTKSGRFLTGRAVPYGTDTNLGWFIESHRAGSLAKSIKEAAAALPLLMFHDSRTAPVGVSHEWDDNDADLRCVWRMDRSAEAERAVQLAADGILTGLSIGFQSIRSEWDYVEEWDPTKGAGFLDHVTRTESRLLEVSLTPTPAFKDAQVLAVRSADRRHIESRHHGHVSAPRVQEWRHILEGLKRDA